MVTFWIYVRVIKSERGLNLAICYLPGYLHDVVIERPPYIFKIAEYESFCKVESDGNDIAGILSRERHSLFSFKFMFEQEFFVIYTSFN